MTIAEAILMEIEQEAIATRKCLERIPADRLDWKPAEKSMSAGELGMHIATSPSGILWMMMQDETGFPDPPAEKPAITHAGIMQAFEDSLARQRETFPGLTDEFMTAEWKFLKDGKVLMALPRVAFARMVLLSHIYHHRGQLSVYLRQLDVPVPSIYGPSADELPPFMQEAAG
ncbi:DinB family protein [bacterium]|nr:DinB family protein [bacterium]MCB1220804.1 DinB family protein [bacterium]UNM09452.1 MAG: DinB family protein [Planctomycetales bacterium]